MAVLNQCTATPSFIGSVSGSSGSNSSTTLTNAYVQNTSGDAVAIRFVSRSTGSIDAIWVYVTAVSGSPVLAATVIGENTGQAARPATATTLDTSTAADTPTANAWCKITFGTPYTPTAGEILWIVVHKTSGTTCDIRTATNGNPVFGGINFPTVHSLPLTTSNGFTTDGTAVIKAPYIIKQGSLYYGQPFTQRTSAPFASNTLERGFKFTAPATCEICGVNLAVGASQLANANLYSASGTPGGTALQTWDMDSDTGETTNDLIASKIFDTTYTITRGDVYFFTFTMAANYTGPSVSEVQDYTTYATEIDALRDSSGFLPVFVIDGGAGSFTVQKNYLPEIALLVSEHPARGPVQLINASGLVT